MGRFLKRFRFLVWPVSGQKINEERFFSGSIGLNTSKLWPKRPGKFYVTQRKTSFCWHKMPTKCMIKEIQPLSVSVANTTPLTSRYKRNHCEELCRGGSSSLCPEVSTAMHAKGLGRESFSYKSCYNSKINCPCIYCTHRRTQTVEQEIKHISLESPVDKLTSLKFT